MDFASVSCFYVSIVGFFSAPTAPLAPERYMGEGVADSLSNFPSSEESRENNSERCSHNLMVDSGVVDRSVMGRTT